MKSIEPNRKPRVLITGAARGIGYATAFRLAENGCSVALTDIDFYGRDQQISDEIGQLGTEPLLIREDISDIEKHDSIFEKVVQKFGIPDSLVSSAGVSVMNRGDILEVAPESYDRCQSVNTRAVFFLCRTFSRYLLKKENSDLFRSIVLISSLNSQAVSIDRSEYCVSKAGVSMIAKLFADRLAAHEIGVYEILPGIIETEMTKPSMPKYRAMIENGLAPFGREGKAKEVAQAVSALVLGNFPYTTGQQITVDGGIHMTRY